MALKAACLLLDKDALVNEITATGLFYFLAIGGSCAVYSSQAASSEAEHLTVGVAFAFGVSAYIVSSLFPSATYNPATVVGQIVSGDQGWQQGLVNIVFQILAAILAGAFLEASIHDKNDVTAFYANRVNDAAHQNDNVVGGEFLLSWILFYVWQKTKDTDAHAISVGFTYFLAALFLNNLDRVGLNPARSIASLTCASARNVDTSDFADDSWIFIIFPVLGAVCSAIWTKFVQPFVPKNSTPSSNDIEADLVH